ncbi:CPBP family intramembrane glutamic endopeptidase [Geodermatophilus sp. SYSU D00815]
MSASEPEPYTGPPPTGPYGAPPAVAGIGAPWTGSPPPVPAVPAPQPPWAPGPWAGPPPPSWPPAPVPWPPPAPWPPPPGVRWEPPPGTPPHDVPQPFLHAMRSRDWRWWRPLLGLLLFGVVFAVANVIVVLVALVTTVGVDLAMQDLVDPATLLVTNLTLIAAIPTVWLAWGVAHGMRTGWSSSVLARLRWRLVLPFTLRALATLGVGIALTVGIAVAIDPESVSGPVEGFGWLLVVVILTTPLQSAAEEYLFRGYLSQAIAGWVRHPTAGAVVAGVVTAALFSLAHVPPDFLTFLSRFGFGLAASAVVWLTGGLEAAIVLHAVNNVLVFLLAGALGDAVATEDVSGPGLLVVLLDLLALGAYVAVVAVSRKKLRPELRTAALDLRQPVAGQPAGATPGGW